MADSRLAVRAASSAMLRTTYGRVRPIFSPSAITRPETRRSAGYRCTLSWAEARLRAGFMRLLSSSAPIISRPSRAPTDVAAPPHAAIISAATCRQPRGERAISRQVQPQRTNTSISSSYRKFGRQVSSAPRTTPSYRSRPSSSRTVTPLTRPSCTSAPPRAKYAGLPIALRALDNVNIRLSPILMLRFHPDYSILAASCQTCYNAL